MIIFPSQSFLNDNFFSITLPTQRILLDSLPFKQSVSKKRSICNNDENHNESSNKLRVVNSRLQYEINELEDHFNISIDVPGVKLSDIDLDVVEDSKLQIKAKRKTNENTVKKYEQTFVFDTKKVDLTNVRAELENGLLYLKIGKKKPEEPISIDVTNERTSEISENGNKQEHDEVLALDLPGVKIDDIHVKLHEESILVDAKRHRGNSSFMIRKVIAVNAKEYDLKHAKANLNDGVLTVLAPRIATSDKDLSISKTGKQEILISSGVDMKQDDAEIIESSSPVEGVESKTVEPQKE